MQSSYVCTKLLTSEEAAGCEIARNRANSWVSQESKLETGLGGWGGSTEFSIRSEPFAALQ